MNGLFNAWTKAELLNKEWKRESWINKFIAEMNNKKQRKIFLKVIDKVNNQ